MKKTILFLLLSFLLLSCEKEDVNANTSLAGTEWIWAYNNVERNIYSDIILTFYTDSKGVLVRNLIINDLSSKISSRFEYVLTNDVLYIEDEDSSEVYIARINGSEMVLDYLDETYTLTKK